ncbi:MAG: DUF3052 family protein [Verrucomicrobia bacterium]|nr:DUF3052 family protein [Verrucomicrobiota bacterium]MBV8277399.1 DUF3052 family protein [Verrucomicrobiota bacterium]
MGHEIICRATLGNRNSEGKAQLESDHLVFRGEFRCKIFFRDLAKVTAHDGTLTLGGPEGELRIELGEKAAFWAEKILHPKSRSEKLGLKAGTQVALINLADSEFETELAKASVALVSPGSRSRCDAVFFGAQQATELAKIPDILPRLKERGVLWVVYPKGQSNIPESGVILAGRAAGLKDVKVVSFSPKQTALKFVRPLNP